MTDYADLEKRLRERTVAVRGPAGVFTTVLSHQPDALCIEAADVLASAREAFLQIATSGRAAHPLLYALLVARRQLPDLYDSQGNDLSRDRSDPTETASSE